MHSVGVQGHFRDAEITHDRDGMCRAFGGDSAMNVVRTVVLGLATAVAAGLLAGCNADENAAAPTTAKSRATQTLTVRMVGASTVSVDQHVQLASASYSVAVSPVPPESSPGDVERFRPSITHLTAQAPDQPTQRVRQV